MAEACIEADIDLQHRAVPPAESRPQAPAGKVRVPLILGIWDRAPYGSGENTGNLLHARAARLMLKDLGHGVPKDDWSAEDVADVRSRFSHIVIITANAIRIGQKVNEWSDRQDVLRRNIEKAKLPVVVFGLGAQASSPDQYRGTIDDSTRRLLAAISENTPVIGVRGAFTAEVLRHNGIHNVAVIGCQSCFYSLMPYFGVRLNLAMDAPDRVAFNLTGFTRERALFRIALDSRCDMFGQSELAELRLKDDPRPASEIGIDDKLIRPEVRKWVQDKAGTLDEYVTYVKNHFHQFYDIDQWFDHVKGRYRFSFGTRFHGNMLALQAGIPALWVVHDTRTMELCDYFRLPHIGIREAVSMKRLEDFIERTDYSDFIRAYPDRYRRIHDYFSAHGLNHRLPEPLRP